MTEMATVKTWASVAVTVLLAVSITDTEPPPLVT